MRMIDKDEFLNLLHSGEVVGKVISTMEPDCQTPVIYEFRSLVEGSLEYLLTNENQGLSYISYPFNYYIEDFIDEVVQAPYTEIYIVNEEPTDFWEV